MASGWRSAFVGCLVDILQSVNNEYDLLLCWQINRWQGWLSNNYDSITPLRLWLRYCQICCMQSLPSFCLICSTCKKMGVRSCVPQLFISFTVYLKGAGPLAEPNLAPNRRGAQFAKNRLCWTFFGIDWTDQVMWVAHKNALLLSRVVSKREK